MKVTDTDIDDLKVIIPQVFEDSRGYFFESYNKQKFEDQQLYYNFIQDNQSESAFGTIRGLHFQINPYAQAKLIRVLKGIIIDIVVDLRKHKTTFGKYFSIELSEHNKKQLLIPPGFAHGFSVLSKIAVVSYKIDKPYKPEYEIGVKFDDAFLNIDWKINKEDMIVSEKDLLNKPFNNSEIYFK